MGNDDRPRQSAFDALYPPGQQHYWRADFVDELSDKAIAARVEHGSKLPTPQASMHLYPIDAAVHRVASGDSAFAYRDSRKKEYDPGNLFRINQNIQPAE